MTKGTKEVSVPIILAWIFAVLFIFTGLSSLIESFISGVLFILLGIILLPPFDKWIKDEYNLKIPHQLRIFVVLILFILIGIFISEDNNSAKVVSDKDIYYELIRLQNTFHYTNEDYSKKMEITYNTTAEYFNVSENKVREIYIKGKSESWSAPESNLNEYGENYEIELRDACYMSQEFVKKNLKAPSTADFQNCYDASIYYNGEQEYSVSSYVDSQNGFGAQIRTEYYAIVKDLQYNDKWSLIDLQF